MYTTVNGARIYFDVDGEGLTPDGPTMREKPTVVMVHGGPGADHTVSKPYFSHLTDIAQVVYYHHRGNGRSPGYEPKDWNLAQWGDDLRGLCDALETIERVSLLRVPKGAHFLQRRKDLFFHRRTQRGIERA